LTPIVVRLPQRIRAAFSSRYGHSRKLADDVSFRLAGRDRAYGISMSAPERTDARLRWYQNFGRKKPETCLAEIFMLEFLHNRI